MRFGCCIQKIQDVARVQAAGYDFYEFAGRAVAAMDEAEFASLERETRRTGLPCIGFNSYCAGRPAIVGPDFSPAEAAQYAGLLCGRGRRLGIRAIGIGAPAARRLPADYPKETARRQCLDFLRITAAEAERHGLKLLFEAVHSRACDYAVHTAEAAALVAELGLAQVEMVLDFYHMHVMGETLAQGEAALAFLRHVHISTCGPALERGFPQAADRAEYREIFRWLKNNGYDDTVSIEADGFDPEMAALSLKLLREVDREISA